MADVCVIAHIRGCVQGVGFRYYTQLKAQKLGLRGWVKNLPDGSVESCIYGTMAQIQDMQRWLAHGPRGAIVESVTFSTASLADNTQDFFVRS